MSDKILSTFDSEHKVENLYIEGIQISSDSKHQNLYEVESDVIRDWAPGNTLFFEIKLNRRTLNLKPVINWYCSQTHLRGLIDNYDNHQKKLTGMVRGDWVRGKIELKLQLLDDDGYVIDQPDRRIIVLEGNLSYFPITITEMGGEVENTMCYLDISPNSDPEELFSISTCRAVINSEGSLFNKKSSDLMDHMPVKGFYLYEIWRQMIEICLNNEAFEDFMFLDNNNDEIKLGHVWTNILQKAFKGRTLNEIRKLRENNYGEFSSLIQSEILKNISGY